MNGSVLFEGNPILSGSLNVNTSGNIEPLNIEINENGTRTITPPSGVDGYAPITIDTNVPIPKPVLDTLNVTSNGTYTPPTGVDGYDEVNVSVSLPENAYLLEEYEDVPTDIASFEASDAPLKSLTASIEPQQDLHGYDSPWAGGAGTNKWDEEYQEGYYRFDGQYVYSADQLCTKNRISITPDTEYYLGTSNALTAVNTSIIYYDSNGDFLRREYSGKGTFTTPNNAYYMNVNFGTGYGVTYNNDLCVNYPSTVTTYSPYSNICPISGWTEEVITVADDLQNPTVTHTTTIPFTDSQGNPVEVYGGSVDAVNGIVTPCPYYASYNREELTSEWLSDRDVYAPNTTPTIGAQVVNIGATGTPFSVQPTSIKSLDGENNVSASTGDVEELKYFTRATS